MVLIFGDSGQVVVWGVQVLIQDNPYIWGQIEQVVVQGVSRDIMTVFMLILHTNGDYIWGQWVGSRGVFQVLIRDNPYIWGQ